jgi:hypothetical protein
MSAVRRPAMTGTPMARSRSARRPGVIGLSGSCPGNSHFRSRWPRVDLVQQVPAGVRGRSHASRHDGADVPVSRRAITPVIAQYTRDTELVSRCS